MSRTKIGFYSEKLVFIMKKLVSFIFIISSKNEKYYLWNFNA